MDSTEGSQSEKEELLILAKVNFGLGGSAVCSVVNLKKMENGLASVYGAGPFSIYKIL